jgi:DNA (cytosine-5)-methyltransferase 1
MTRPRAAEFFAGIGLVRMALERAGWSVVFANDIDPAKFDIYRENFGHQHFALTDIRYLHGARMPDVELATASFPCIDLSLAGNRNGLAGYHSSAYWEFHRIIEEMGERKPPALLLENVVGLLSSNRGEDLRSIIASLNKFGYGCDAFVVDGAHFVPQSRPRLFVVAAKPGSGKTATDPITAHGPRPHQVVEFITANADLRWTHAKLPELPPKRRDLKDLLERLPDGAPEWWAKRRQSHLSSQISPAHKKILRELADKRHLSFLTVYKRVRPAGCRAELRWDGLAGCLRTPRGGSSKQFVIQAGFGRWRTRNMTAREYARLQGVPDSFKIHVPYNQALFGFGDAVCVPAVEWVLKNCLSH